MKAEYRKIYNELKKRTPIPRKIKAAHEDIEEAVVKAGGQRGSYGQHA